MKTLILTLVLLAQLGAPAYAQSGQPETKAPNPATTDSQGSGNIDKERVQERWGISTDTTTKKDAKSSTPGKPQPQKSSNTTP